MSFFKIVVLNSNESIWYRWLILGLQNAEFYTLVFLNAGDYMLSSLDVLWYLFQLQKATTLRHQGVFVSKLNFIPNEW